MFFQPNGGARRRLEVIASDRWATTVLQTKGMTVTDRSGSDKSMVGASKETVLMAES
ncbi:hypothetical protein [Porphyromonas loveana]|uniref:hypothetical protein n=1 Tax=Porphyromonas loveana TaxID=1884669 RepID=UPI0035A0A82D